MLNPTSPEHLVNAEGQPYFLWDSEMTLEQLRSGLQDPDPEVRAYLAGKLMRQAKPDDVFTFLTAREIRQLWPRLERYLGKTREFWTWLFELTCSLQARVPAGRERGRAVTPPTGPPAEPPGHRAPASGTH
jgi:hypothetical protein